MRVRVASLITAVAACLALAAAPAGAIVNGTPDGDGHPNVGAIIVALPPEFGGFNVQFCTGSLLTPTILLTAGHCTDGFDQFGIPDSDILVTFDTDTRLSTPANAPEHAVGVLSHETHPEFRYGGLSTAYNDVGVLHLAAPVLDRDPVTLPPENWLSDMAAKGGLRGRTFVSVGYGLIGTNHRSVLNPNNVPTFDDLRRVTFGPFSVLTQYQLGILDNTSATGGGGTCNGDSGGPAFPGWAGAPPYEVAVTTSGDPVCRSLSRRQRLDTPVVQDWLREVVAADAR